MKSLSNLLKVIRERYQQLPGGVHWLIIGITIIYIVLPDPIPVIDEILLIATQVYLNKK